VGLFVEKVQRASAETEEKHAKKFPPIEKSFAHCHTGNE